MIFSPSHYATSKTTSEMLQQIQNQVVPYSVYWWKRRPTASSWTETRVKSSSQGYSNKTATRISGTDNTTYYHLAIALDRYPHGDEESSHEYATLTYANSISINQSTGAISMVSPSTYACSESDHYYESAFNQKFQGKYVKGFIGCTDGIFYIPSGFSMSYKSWAVSSEDADISYTGYIFTADNSVQPMAIGSVKNTTTGAWETISSDSDTTYPKSGTSGGYDWRYLGRVVDAAIDPPSESIPKWTTVTITSANFNGSAAIVNIPSTLAIVAISSTISRNEYGFYGVIDTVNNKASGVWARYYSSTTGSYNEANARIVVGGGNLGTLSHGTAYVSDGGIKIELNDGQSGMTCTVSYLPLL